MTESRFQAKLLTKLRNRLKDATVWKFSDRFNAGIPDVCVINKKKATWFELKVAPNKPSKLQAFYLKRIGGHLVTLEADGSITIDSFVDSGSYYTIEETIRQMMVLCGPI